MHKILVLLAILSSLLLTACPKLCKPQTARCLDGKAQLCRPDGKWQDVVDCKKVDKVPWNCTCTNTTKCSCKKPAN